MEQPLLCLIKRNQIVHLLPLVLPIFVRTNWNWLLPDISLSLSPFYYFNLSCLLLVFTSLILSSRRFFVVPLVLILPPFFVLWYCLASDLSHRPLPKIFSLLLAFCCERETPKYTMNFTYQDYVDGGLKEVHRGLQGSERGPPRSAGVREGSSGV